MNLDYQKAKNVLIPLMTTTMTMMMMMMNWGFFGMTDRPKVFNYITSQEHSKRSSPFQILNALQARCEPPQNLLLGLDEYSDNQYTTTYLIHFPT